MQSRKKELLSRVGSMQQLMYVRPLKYEEGRAEGMKAYEVKNGPLAFTVLADKCLDITDVSFMGCNMNFLSKPGLMGRNHFDTNGDEALRSIMGGMLFTCGLENICAPCQADGKDYPMHGRIRTTPAEHVSADAKWNGEEYEAVLSGEMREAELFGENLVFRRRIETQYGKNQIHIVDEVTNEGFRAEPMMLLYHMNVGYPLLCEKSEILLPTRKVTARDAAAEGHTGNWNHMESPRDGETEYVFLHELAADEEGNTFAAVINEALGIGLKIEFNQRNLPYFMQWKSIASGDYVVGLEPANSSVYGRLYHMKQDTLHTIDAFETEQMELTLTFLQGAELQEVKKEVKKLLAGESPCVKIKGK
ncbi:aldose 1-epimerase family protein [Roseburia hominis]